MKEDKDYIRDIAEIRSMMERSSKFLSLSGWAGIMAGVYALVGSFIAWKVLGFNPEKIQYQHPESGSGLMNVLHLAAIVFLFAISTAVFDSFKKAKSKGERVWNPTSRRLLTNMAVPLLAGTIVILVIASRGLIGLVAPLTLVFYGLALFSGGNFTFKTVKVLGITEILIGLFACYFIEYGLLLWAVGFGVVHIIYGIYMFRYEK
jgi:hypothetical protein